MYKMSSQAVVVVVCRQIPKLLLSQLRLCFLRACQKCKEKTETKLVALLVGWDGEIRRMEVTKLVWKFKNIGSGTESVLCSLYSVWCWRQHFWLVFTIHLFSVLLEKTSKYKWSSIIMVQLLWKAFITVIPLTCHWQQFRDKMKISPKYKKHKTAIKCGSWLAQHKYIWMSGHSEIKGNY